MRARISDGARRRRVGLGFPRDRAIRQTLARRHRTDPSCPLLPPDLTSAASSSTCTAASSSPRPGGSFARYERRDHRRRRHVEARRRADAAYEAKPPGEVRGAIVVVQEAFGVNPHIEDVTRRAAAAGYHAVAPDLFHRSGPGAVVEYGQFEKVMKYFQASRATRDPHRRRRRARSPARRRVRRQQHRHRRLLLRRPGLVPRRAPVCARRGRGLLRRRHRDRPVPAVPAARRRHGRAADPVARPVRRSGRVDTRRRRRTTPGRTRAAPVDTEVVRYADAGHGFHCDQRPTTGRRRGRRVATRARLVLVAPA